MENMLKKAVPGTECDYCGNDEKDVDYRATNTTIFQLYVMTHIDNSDMHGHDELVCNDCLSAWFMEDPTSLRFLSLKILEMG